MESMDSIEKLLSFSSEPLSGQPVTINLPDFGGYGQLGEQLLSLLRNKNGFYAFESALHVLPAAVYEKEMTLSRWNAFGLWRHEYGNPADNMLIFAEDAFGDQFCLSEGKICSFDAETGEVKTLASSFEERARRILREHNVLTGYPLMHQWQTEQGALPIGTRLMPKIPFVLGGQFALDNLYTIAAVSGMRTRGNLAKQIKDLPDGAQVEFRIIE
jgi:hypothetical protein